MRIVPISEVFNLDHDDDIPSIIGRVSNIYPSIDTESQFGKGTIQNLTISDRNGKAVIKVKVRDRKELDPEFWKGKTICFSCVNGTKGKSGVKAKDDTYRNKTSRIVSVTPTALIEEVDENLDPQGTNSQRNDPLPRQKTANPPQQPAQRQTAAPAQAQAAQTTPQNGHAESNGHAAIRVTELRYDRTVNTGNYSSEKIGITLAIDEGMKAADALALARKFIDKHIAESAVSA